MHVAIHMYVFFSSKNVMLPTYFYSDYYSKLLRQECWLPFLSYVS